MITCPDCGSANVLVYAKSAYFINTVEFFCHSSKPHDDDAECRCNDCDWEGKRRDIDKERK